MTEEMEKRLCEVICVAPWTELILWGGKKVEWKRKGKCKVRIE